MTRNQAGNTSHALAHGPLSHEYKVYRIAWIALLVFACILAGLTIFGQALLPDGFTTPILVVANICIFVAIFIDVTKVRRLRRESKQAQAAALKSKAYRAEEKRRRAQAREAAKAPVQEPASEEGMTLFQRLVKRAKESGEAANIKGSGL